jgi:hypothetical protein
MGRGAVAPLRFVGCHGPFDCSIRYVWPCPVWWRGCLICPPPCRPLTSDPLAISSRMEHESAAPFDWELQAVDHEDLSSNLFGIWIMEWLMSSILTCLRESPVPSRCANHLISFLFRAIWRSIHGYTTTNAYHSYTLPSTTLQLIEMGDKSTFLTKIYCSVCGCWNDRFVLSHSTVFSCSCFHSVFTLSFLESLSF